MSNPTGDALAAGGTLLWVPGLKRFEPQRYPADSGAPRPKGKIPEYSLTAEEMQMPLAELAVRYPPPAMPERKKEPGTALVPT